MYSLRPLDQLLLAISLWQWRVACARRYALTEREVDVLRWAHRRVLEAP